MRERELTTALYEGLSEIPSVTVYSPREEAARAGIVSFNVADLSSSQVADQLDHDGIAVRGGLHCAPGAHRFLGTLKRGIVRASVGHATTFEDIDALLRSVSAMRKKGPAFRGVQLKKGIPRLLTQPREFVMCQSSEPIPPRRAPRARAPDAGTTSWGSRCSRRGSRRRGGPAPRCPASSS